MIPIRNILIGTLTPAAMTSTRCFFDLIFLIIHLIFMQTIWCCVPYSVEDVLSQYTEANDTVTNAECGVPNCANSYFGDFAKSLNTLNDPLTGCSSGVKVRAFMVMFMEAFAW
jgi:hypothetical protein